MSNVLGIGLMSGTSLDGIDAVIVEIEGIDEKLDVRIVDSLTRRYSKSERDELLNLCSPSSATLQKISSANMYLGKVFGEVVNQLLAKSNYSKEDIHFVSSHGQTIYHQPFDGESDVDVASTLQIGDISVLSETTGIAVVGDFRTADMAVNGQGAPLVSYLDYELFRDSRVSRAIQNIGGIGNVTYIPKNSSRDDVKSFDTGPGNMIIDEIVSQVTKGEQSFDKDGKMAFKGKINQDLLDMLMNHEYLAMEPPKTTGRELFGKQFVNEIFKDYSHLSPEDLVTTVSEYTSLSIANSYKRFFEAKGFGIDEVIIGGGGSYNPYLLKRLKDHLLNMDVYIHENFDLSSDLKEAMAFAVLGFQCILGKYNTIPSATGADKAVIMGKITYNRPEALERIDALRRGSR